MMNCYSDSYSLTKITWRHVYIRLPPHGHRQPAVCWLTDICYVMFVNMMRSVRFYFINTMVIYKFTALLKFTYIMHADLLRLFLHCAF